MLIRPELEALRSDDTSQRLAQARLGEVLEGWQALPHTRAVQEELDRYAGGEPIDDLPRLAALFDPASGQGEAFIASIMAPMLAEQARNPLGQVALRHFTDDLIAASVLLRHGATTLTLAGLDGAALTRKAPPVSVNFAPTETVELILRGTAQGEMMRLEEELPGGAARLSRSPLALRPGMATRRDGQCEAQWLIAVQGSLITLKLQRRPAMGGTAREYLLADGSLVHQAAACARDSRLELVASLLGRMGRRDAAPLLAAMAEEQASPALRWQVLRECLALDSAEGFRSLGLIARDAADPLAAPAGALRAQLLEQFPVLNGVDQCPV